MATSMLGELCCSVCLDTYSDPVTLPCMHSFCRLCLLDLSQTCTASVPSHGVISCPECRQTTDLGEQGVKGLPKNCTLANLVEKLDKDQDKKHDPNCSVCDTSPARVAVRVCFDCNVSYCGECIYLHPSRGALAKHVLVDINGDDRCTESLVCKKAEERDEENDKYIIFCHTCNEFVEDEKSHVDHKTTSLKEARLDKCTSLEAALENLEKTRRALRRGIYQSESRVEQLQEEKQKKLLDVLMDEIRKYLALKESGFTQQINDEYKDSVYKTEMQIKNKKEQLPKITDIVNRVQMLLEQEHDDLGFLKKSVELEKVLQSFEYPEESRSSQAFEPIVHDVKKIATLITDILKEPEVQGTVPGQQLKDKVHLIALTPKWESKFACLLVKWDAALSDKKFDVMVQQVDTNRSSDDIPTIVYSAVQQTELLLCNLSTDTEYKVSVMIHGHPKTESEPIHGKTLPSITVQQLETRIRLISVTPKWNSQCGSLLVKWDTASVEQNYDVQVLPICPDKASDDIQTIVYSSVQHTQLLVCNLFIDTEYKVSVMIHGHPKTESVPIHVKTLPFITASFTFDVSTASEDVEIDIDGLKMMHEDQSNYNITKFDDISGTVSSHFLEPYQYWETDLRFFMGCLISGETAYEIGICPESKVDRISNVRKNHFAYVCCHSMKGHNSVMEFYAKGKRAKEFNVPWQNPYKINLGFFFNIHKKQFSIINVDSGENMMTFRNIKPRDDKYVAVFDIGDDGVNTKLEIKLNTANNIENVPDIVLTNLI